MKNLCSSLKSAAAAAASAEESTDEADSKEQMLCLINSASTNTFPDSAAAAAATAAAAKALRIIASRFGRRLSSLLPSLWTNQWSLILAMGEIGEGGGDVNLVSFMEVASSLKSVETIVPAIHSSLVKEILQRLRILVGPKFLGMSNLEKLRHRVAKTQQLFECKAGLLNCYHCVDSLLALPLDRVKPRFFAGMTYPSSIFTLQSFISLG